MREIKAIRARSLAEREVMGDEDYNAKEAESVSVASLCAGG